MYVIDGECKVIPLE